MTTKRRREFWVYETGFHSGEPNYYSQYLMSEDKDSPGKEWFVVQEILPGDPTIEDLQAEIEKLKEKLKRVSVLKPGCSYKHVHEGLFTHSTHDDENCFGCKLDEIFSSGGSDD